MEERLANVERRIEQILPTLATSDDLQAAVAPLATKAELRAAIAPLATKVELRAAIAESEQRMCDRMDAIATGLRKDMREDMRTHVAEAIAASEQRLRTHFDVVAESLRDDIRLVAEAVVTLSERVDRTS